MVPKAKLLLLYNTLLSIPLAFYMVVWLLVAVVVVSPLLRSMAALRGPVQYAVGRYDGRRFEPGEWYPLDLGGPSIFYAPNSLQDDQGRRIEIPLGEEYRPQQELRDRVVRFDAHRFLDLGEGLVGLALGEQEPRADDPRVGPAGLLGDHLVDRPMGGGLVAHRVLHASHPGAAGLRWWSTYEALWSHVTLFDRARASLRVLEIRVLTVDHPAVVAAAKELCSRG